MAVYLAKLFRFSSCFLYFLSHTRISIPFFFLSFFPTAVASGYWNRTKFNWSYRCTNSRYTSAIYLSFRVVPPRFLLAAVNFPFSFQKLFKLFLVVAITTAERGIISKDISNREKYRWNLQICQSAWPTRDIHPITNSEASFQNVNNLVEVDSRVWDNLKVSNLSHVSIEAYTRERSQLVTHKSI